MVRNGISTASIHLQIHAFPGKISLKPRKILPPSLNKCPLLTFEVIFCNFDLNYFFLCYIILDAKYMNRLSFKCIFIDIVFIKYYQCCKTRSTRPINRRLDATRPPTLPINVTGSNKQVNHGQRRSIVVNGGQTCGKPSNLTGST